MELARLASLAGCTVLLIEQGQSRGNHLFQRIPLMAGKMIGNRHFVDSRNSSEQAVLDGRQIPVLSGRGLGGASRINGNVAYTGPLARYEKLFGPMRLDFSEILKSIRGDAPRVISWHDDLTAKFLAASAVVSPDHDLEFLGGGHLYVNTKWGLRSNHFDRFKAAENVTVIKGKAREIELSGSRVREVYLEDGQRIQAERFILSAGSIGSPQLLMHSGIGEARQLEQAGIPVHLDQPHVGAHLKDHANVRITFSCTGHNTLNQKTRGVHALCEGVKYVLPRQNSILRGPGASAGINLSAGDPYMDALRLQLVHFTHNRSQEATKGIQFDKSQSASIGICQLWPFSEGAVRLAPADSGLDITVDPGYFADKRDLNATVDGVVQAQQHVVRMGFATEELGEDLAPFVKSRAYSGFHLIGSNRMAEGEEHGVVGPNFGVFGIDNLDVCDASVMPDHLSSHSYLPTIAMARMYGAQAWGVK